jgi:hypothetical protein
MKSIAVSYALAIIWETWPIFDYGPTGWNIYVAKPSETH